MNELNVLDLGFPEGGDINLVSRIFSLAVFAVMMAALLSYAAEIDRGAVDFKTPAEIKWVRNAAGTNESVVLFGVLRSVDSPSGAMAHGQGRVRAISRTAVM